MNEHVQMIGAIERSVQRLNRWPSLLLGLAALFWAGNTVAARLAIDEISPLTLTALRWVMVAAVLWLVYGREVRRHWPQIRPALALIVLLALFGMTGFNALYYVAAHDTSAINIAILQGAMPIFVLAGAYLAHGSRAGLVQQLGVFITALGVAVVATRGAPLSILEVEFNRGDLVMLAACVLYALYTVALRDRPDMPAVPFFALLALIAAITSLPLVAFEVMAGTFRLPTAQGLAVTVWIAVFPSFLSQIFYLRGVDLIGPGRAGVFVNLVPVFAAVL
ncbi:MAG TPA: DMT family transporter, partial [Hyphomicrobiaceae bacterium]|nr:DMT family transporter [Hyphomicrobiaceae bacterium]